jgi:hypothetical protein
MVQVAVGVKQPGNGQPVFPYKLKKFFPFILIIKARVYNDTLLLFVNKYVSVLLKGVHREISDFEHC